MSLRLFITKKIKVSLGWEIFPGRMSIPTTVVETDSDIWENQVVEWSDGDSKL